MLVLVLAFIAACAHPESARAPRAEPTETRAANGVPSATALANYATGVSVELNEGMAEALYYYRRALELDSQNIALTGRLAQWHLNRKEFAEAAALLERSRQANPLAPEPWFWLGIVHRANEQPAEALHAFQQALQLAPTHLEALQGLLDLQLQQDDTTNLVKTLDRAWEQESSDPRYWMRLGELHGLVLRQKPSLHGVLHADRIKQAYEKARALAPQDPDLLLRLADLTAANDNIAEATALYEQLFELRPSLTAVREKLALAYLRVGQREKSAALLEEILKREPLRFEIYNLLGEVYDELDQDERAIRNYQQSLLINPNQLAPYLRIFLLQMKLKQTEDALATLTTAAKNFPTVYVIPFYQGIYHAEKKDYAKALTYFRDAETLATEATDDIKLDSAFYFHYAAACERAGHPDQAVPLFRKAIALDPNNHQALNWLGYMWADQGENLAEARQLIERAVALSPDNGAYLDSLGWVLFKQGHAPEALSHLRRAAELEKDDATVLDHLAAVLLHLGQREEAVRVLHRAAELAPNNRDIAIKLEQLTATPVAP